MAQLHAYRLPDGQLVLDLQSDFVDTPFRLVAPLRRLEARLRTFTRLEPVLEVAGTAMSLHVTEAVGVRARLVSGPAVADLRGARDAVTRALDVLFSGF
jgi:hypothetical protein